MAYGLGRTLNHDVRSRNFPGEQFDGEWTSVNWDYAGPVLDQGETNRCTGFTMAHFLNTQFGLNARRQLNDYEYFDDSDAHIIYSLATTFDEFPGQMPSEDTGSSGLAVAKAAKEMGYISGYNHFFGFDEFLKGLALSPILVGTLWYEGMFTPDANGLVTIQNSADAGGHQYLAMGADKETQLIKFLSSWGPDWGKGGYFYLTFAEFAELLSYDGDALVPVPL